MLPVLRTFALLLSSQAALLGLAPESCLVQPTLFQPIHRNNWQVPSSSFNLYLPSFSYLCLNLKRALILDYLVQRCYTRTARALAADSTIRHLDADGDEICRPNGEDDPAAPTEEALHQADLRRGAYSYLVLTSLPHLMRTTYLDIQTNILSGRVDNAIDLLNTNFPSTLSSTSTSAGTESTTPRAENSQLKLVKSVLPFTVEPAHLYLELRILAFIEASRTKPLPYVGESPTRPPSSDPDPTPRISPSNNLRDPSGEVDRDAHLSRLLTHAHELYECSQALQNPHERAEYQHELSAVGSLLAYKVPEQSPMAKYLSQERRQAVADEINSAILCLLPLPLIATVDTLTWPMQIERASLQSHISSSMFGITPLSGTT